MLTLVHLLGGLGLLFIGLKLMSTHLQQAMGRRVRGVLKAATRSRLRGFFCGTFAGAVAQSSNAVTLIAGNLVRSGALTTREAIPVVAGANVGTAALVFIAAIDLHLAVLALVGLVGFGFQLRLDRAAGRREWMGVLLGLALLFLGLDFIKAAPKGMSMADMTALLDHGISPLAGLLIGFVAALITQSASTATILAVAAIGAGMLGLEDAAVMILGANFGSGIAALVFAGGLEGTGRQLCYVHVLVKAVGCLVVAVVWLAASTLMAGGLPIPEVRPDEARWIISLLFLALQLSGGLAVTLFSAPSARLVLRISPPGHEDRVSRPHFIHAQALGDPSTALDLAARETGRLIGLLPDLMPDLDQGHRRDAHARSSLQRGIEAVAQATAGFLVDLIDRGLGREDLDIALRAQAELDLILSLKEAMADFAGQIDALAPLPPLAFNMSESLRTIALQLVDARDGDCEDADMLIAITADRSAMMERVRRQLADTPLGSGDGTRRLLSATSLFERSVWLVRRLAVSLRTGKNEDNAGTPTDLATREMAHAD